MFAHIDVDAFFASVLQRKYPQLLGKPLLALGMGGGCVIAASYEAKAYGIKTGMRFAEAKKLCPQAQSVPSDFTESAHASKHIERIIQEHCPLIEQMSIDEWYCDLRALVGGIPNDPHAWGKTIQRHIQRATALSVSVGVAPTKLLAKMAGEEHKPAGCTALLSQEDIQAFLKRRPIAAIPGIGRARMRVVEELGWTTAWHLQAAPTARVRELFGKNGIALQQELSGMSIAGIAPKLPPKSISRARSFRRTTDETFIWSVLMEHLQVTVLRMRRKHLQCSGLSLWLRDSTYKHRGNHLSLQANASSEEELMASVKQLYLSTRRKGLSMTQAGIALWGLQPHHAVQASLFIDSATYEEQESLQSALDTLRERFGKGVITRGPALLRGSKPGPSERMFIRAGRPLDQPVYDMEGNLPSKNNRNRMQSDSSPHSHATIT